MPNDGWYNVGLALGQRSKKNEIANVEDAYNGLLSSVEAFKSGDKDYAGQKMSQSLQALGLVDKNQSWEYDKNAGDDERVKLIDAATKNFNKGHYTATEMYDRIAHAVNGDFSKKLGSNQREALSNVQKSQQEKLMAQYMGALTTSEDSPAGVSQRLAVTEQLPKDYQPEDIQGSGLLDAIKKGTSGYDVSNDALIGKMAQDVPVASNPLMQQMALIQSRGENRREPNIPTAVVTVMENGKPTVKIVPKQVGTLGEAPNRMADLGKTRGINVVDPNDPSSVIPMTWDEIAKLKEQGIRVKSAAYSPLIKEGMSQASQRGGATTANINDAYRTYHDLAPTMKQLRKKVDGNVFPTEGFKNLNQLDQFLSDQASNPDMADMATSIGMMSESLSRALGSTQGGEFMLKYANTLLNKNYSPEAFDRVVDRHEETLRNKLKHRINFGQESTTEIKGNSAGTAKTWEELKKQKGY